MSKGQSCFHTSQQDQYLQIPLPRTSCSEGEVWVICGVQPAVLNGPKKLPTWRDIKQDKWLIHQV